MYILACNVGSTSLKFKLYRMPSATMLLQGRFERVGSQDKAVYHLQNPATGASFIKEGLCVPQYAVGIEMFLEDMLNPQNGGLKSIGQLGAVSFKAVISKGYYGVHLLDDAVIDGMEQYMSIAATHNGPYLDAIRQFKQLLPDTPMVAVFETHFHTTIPIERRIYSVPYEWYETYDIQRMGYHGASHSYIAQQVGQLYSEAVNVISCHLGGSCSVCAIQDGKSMDNSFGFSLQTGIPHASRCGDIDPYIIPFLLHGGHRIEDMLEDITKRGGMLGVSGVSNDMRDIEQAAKAGNQRAMLALEMFFTAVLRYIGSYHVELGGLDCLVFTGGIGENSPFTRAKICNKLRHLGVELDAKKNQNVPNGHVISSDDSKVRVAVIPTDEELVIAQKAYGLLEKHPKPEYE